MDGPNPCPSLVDIPLTCSDFDVTDNRPIFVIFGRHVHIPTYSVPACVSTLCRKSEGQDQV